MQSGVITNYIYGYPPWSKPEESGNVEPIIDKIRRKLSGWKLKMLSRAGRLILIKSVLNNLSMYYLGLFKMPKQVVRKIISIQSKFFWEIKEGDLGMALVIWEIIQRPKKLGDLGVGDLVLKNTSMLFKWWWHFSVENAPLWKQIICSCYDLDANRALVDQQVRSGGGLWGDICNIRRIDANIERYLEVSIRKLVGDGHNTWFWEDLWVGEESLKKRFPTLFSVSIQSKTPIADSGFWDGGTWYCTLLWRRDYFEWETQVFNQLQQVLEQVTMSENQQDRF